MKFFFIYVFSIFFIGIISYSFYTKWGRVAGIEFEFKQSNLSKEDQEKLKKDLKKKIQPFIGQWVWKLSLKKLQGFLNQDPRVEKAHILRQWLHNYRVILLSDTPLFLIMGDKVFYPVTSNGKIIQPIAFSALPDLPFLRGNLFLKNSAWRKKIIKLFLYLPKKGSFSQNNISEIKFSKEKNSFLFFLQSSGLPIRVGANPVEFRPDHVESVLKYLYLKKINWRVMDARFSKKVIVSLY